MPRVFGQKRFPAITIYTTTGSFCSTSTLMQTNSVVHITPIRLPLFSVLAHLLSIMINSSFSERMPCDLILDFQKIVPTMQIVMYGHNTKNPQLNGFVWDELKFELESGGIDFRSNVGNIECRECSSFFYSSLTGIRRACVHIFV